MRIAIHVDTEGIEETVDDLEDIADRGKDFRPVFRKIADDVAKSSAENFTTQGLPVGGWAPLDTQYAAWKSKHAPGAPPMIRSGNLFRSVSQSRGVALDINKHRASYGTKVEYAKFHQYGTTKMPKRQIIFVPQDADREWSGMAKDYVVDGRSGLANE